MSNPFKKITKTADESKKVWDSTLTTSAVETRDCENCGSARPSDSDLRNCAYCGFQYMDLDAEVRNQQKTQVIIMVFGLIKMAKDIVTNAIAPENKKPPDDRDDAEEYEIDDDPVELDAEEQEVLQRMEVYCQKIEARFETSLQQAEEALKEQLIESDYDFNTTLRAWGGMKSPLQDLIANIEQVWEDNAEPELDEDSNFVIDKRWEYEARGEALTNRLDRHENVIEGNLAQLFYDHAIQIADADFNCTQCKAKLSIQKDLFRSQYVTCEYCSTVNTFEPATKFAEIGWHAVDKIAALNSIKEYDALREVETRFQDHRPPVPNVLEDEYRAAYVAYYEKYFAERIILKPDEADRLEEDMARKLSDFG